MSNPLAKRIEAPTSGVRMKPGDVFTFQCDDKTMMAITRTDRPYHFDLADAYNAKLALKGEKEKEPVYRWIAYDNGGLALRRVG